MYAGLALTDGGGDNKLTFAFKLTDRRLKGQPRDFPLSHMHKTMLIKPNINKEKRYSLLTMAINAMFRILH